jgi:hypothetical protein
MITADRVPEESGGQATQITGNRLDKRVHKLIVKSKITMAKTGSRPICRDPRCGRCEADIWHRRRQPEWAVTDAIRRQGKIEWVHVRHEEVKAFAAGAEANDGALSWAIL